MKHPATITRGVVVAAERKLFHSLRNRGIPVERSAVCRGVPVHIWLARARVGVVFDGPLPPMAGPDVGDGELLSLNPYAVLRRDGRAIPALVARDRAARVERGEIRPHQQ